VRSEHANWKAAATERAVLARQADGRKAKDRSRKQGLATQPAPRRGATWGAAADDIVDKYEWLVDTERKTPADACAELAASTRTSYAAVRSLLARVRQKNGLRNPLPPSADRRS
jgi:hypothetical protein